MPVTAAQRLMDAFRRLWRRAFGVRVDDPMEAIARDLRRRLGDAPGGGNHGS